MKMKCMYTSILRGDVVKAGTILDLSETELKEDVVKSYFVKVEGDAVEESAATPTPVAAKAAAGVVAGLSRDQAIMKLQQAGVKFKRNISKDDLVALYEQTFANIAEATK